MSQGHSEQDARKDLVREKLERIEDLLHIHGDLLKKVVRDLSAVIESKTKELENFERGEST